MPRFFENTTTRRLVTFPGLYLGLLALTLLLPLLLPLAVIIDAARWLLARRPAMALRLTTFAWIYLVGEAWALLMLFVLGLRPREESLAATYRAQGLWLDWNFEALRLVFDLSFKISGSADIAPGPILLLSRHASIIDTMLPGRYVVKPHGIRLRYVLKKELLLDPALDLGGQRLPNHFVDRGGDTAEELAALRGLAATLDTDEGVIIYPEGTRFSEAKRLRYIELWKGLPGRLGDIAGRYRRVLPPRPGGTLAMIGACDADVVVLAHHGLEGFARVRDLWSGDIVGSRIDIAFRRVPRQQIPVERERQQLWLFELWSQVDDWVVGEVEE
ncbi:MAG TPA: 1-acyl-sn-glycerol-3-phosphate acyltransferase [Acidimicrobiia bacterium]